MDGFMRALVSVWTDSGFAALTWERGYDSGRTCPAVPGNRKRI